MKIKDFRKMLKGHPSDAQIMLVQNWEGADGQPELVSANDYDVITEQPNGLDDDGSYYVYLYYNPDKEDE
jgi:hypothetical protein